ncbi:MAG: type II toxin-antitoxin system VapC family toxin [Anaerolineae bacterium]|nr:type II toxin-antitoxin system VapC family toxin [Anaerolineae bacterium]
MAGKLLDTNAVIALQKQDKDFLALLDSDEEIFIPAIVIGELYYGAYNSGRPQENERIVDELVADQTILNCDSFTGKYYGKVRHRLKVKGTPIPENDMWIAALAIQFNLALLTNDDHFSNVELLTMQSWSKP